MAHDELHVNDASTIIVTLTEDGVATDVSGATTIQFHFQRPDKSTFFKVGGFVTDGLDGQVSYKLVSDPDENVRDLNIDGPWKIQVKIKESADDFNSAVGKFQVHRNIPV